MRDSIVGSLVLVELRLLKLNVVLLHLILLWNIHMLILAVLHLHLRLNHVLVDLIWDELLLFRHFLINFVSDTRHQVI